MPKEKPKPCPLGCARRPEYTRVSPHFQSWTITCYECGLVLYGKHRESRAELVARWNRRTGKARKD